ncbi:hypothetical protein INT45_011392 [Circinella minor]|uniref:Glycosyltransferase 61 catalytic domain-containing protein n=1 Tax=Circinella minor TaxID=1195481 RepID=A0A8H7SAD3_9FUNG|nr:hypothetical protein INT45_011392 [Circinella minor]
MLQDLNINLINSDQSADVYYQPKVKWRHANAGIPVRNDTLFVYGLYSPEHFSHMLYNGLIPLYRTMKKQGGSRDSWMYRAVTSASFPNMGQPLFTADFFNDGRDIVTDTHSLTSDQQLLLQRDETVCFSKAILGAGVACSLSYYCEQPIESDIYQSFRDEALNYYVTQERWQQHNEHSSIHDTHRDDQACVETVQISIPSSNNNNNNNNTKTIAIINRSKSRKITNEQEIVDALKSNYIIKQINFDKGCSLASSAYLMHDVDILISPHGSQEGAALFMKDNSVVVSINARGYSEDWFAYPFTAMGRRFYNLECQDMTCIETDVTMAERIFKNFGVYLPNQEIIHACASWSNNQSPDTCIKAYYDNPENAIVLNGKKIENEQAWRASVNYLKEAPRKADLSRLIPFISKTVQELDDFKNVSYRMLCDMEKCCGYDCDYALATNVYGSERQGQMKAWTLDPISLPKKSWME